MRTTVLVCVSNSVCKSVYAYTYVTHIPLPYYLTSFLSRVFRSPLKIPALPTLPESHHTDDNNSLSDSLSPQLFFSYRFVQTSVKQISTLIDVSTSASCLLICASQWLRYNWQQLEMLQNSGAVNWSLQRNRWQTTNKLRQWLLLFFYFTLFFSFQRLSLDCGSLCKFILSWIKKQILHENLSRLIKKV